MGRRGRARPLSFSRRRATIGGRGRRGYCESKGDSGLGSTGGMHVTLHLSCYVDETGQETAGRLFIVVAVIVAGEVTPLRQACECVERETGKRAKWHKSRFSQRLAYMRTLVDDPSIRGCLYAVTHIGLATRDFPGLTLRAIARILQVAGGDNNRATIHIDGLARRQEGKIATRLRRMGVVGDKVRGVRKDENEALIRLADATCGLVRDAREGQAEMQALLERAIRLGVLCDLGE